jgi:hypothetical protein
MTTERPTRQLRLKAFRAAARAVTACVLHVPFECVSILPGVDTICPADTRDQREAKVDHGVEHGTLSSTLFQRQAEKQIVVCFSGSVAHQKLTGRLYIGVHLGHAVDLASAACGSQDEILPFLGWPWKQASSLVAFPLNWQAIETLADALSTHRTMSAQQAQCVIQDVMCHRVRYDINHLTPEPFYAMMC